MHIDPRPGLSEESHYESDSWHSEQVTFLLVGTTLQHAVTAADTVSMDPGKRLRVQDLLGATHEEGDTRPVRKVAMRHRT